VTLAMEREKPVEAEGVVVDALPNDMYKVELESGHTLLAHISGTMRTSFTRVLPGERVRVEIASYDHSRGRITYRYK